MVRFLRIHPIASGSSPSSAKRSLRVGESPVLCKSRSLYVLCKSYQPGKCSISKKLLSVQISAFDIYAEPFRRHVEVMVAFSSPGILWILKTMYQNIQKNPV